MIDMLTRFAAEEGPHISVAAEKLFDLGPFEIRNSHLYGWICAIFIGVLLVGTARKVGVKARGGIVQFVELGTQFIIGLLESSLGSRKKAFQYAPLFASIFFFILLNNWLGLLPGVGPAIEVNGIPAFRPFTADLNGTIALAVTAIFIVQYCAVKESGGMNHLKHYFGGNFKNPINIFVGVLELFGELTRVISLSLRLFFNILIGEILISIFTFLGKIGSPLTTLPFITMELFVGLVQAYIFTMLCVTYLGIATAHGDHHEDHDSADKTPADTGDTIGKVVKRVEDVAGSWVQ
jgi:F-type H+-transporting ATPase subunit a